MPRTCRRFCEHLGMVRRQLPRHFADSGVVQRRGKCAPSSAAQVLETAAALSFAPSSTRFPAFLPACSTFKTLNVQQQALGGPLPDEFGSNGAFPNLINLLLQQNYFTGGHAVPRGPTAARCWCGLLVDNTCCKQTSRHPACRAHQGCHHAPAHITKAPLVLLFARHSSSCVWQRPPFDHQQEQASTWQADCPLPPIRRHHPCQLVLSKCFPKRAAHDLPSQQPDR